MSIFAKTKRCMRYARTYVDLHPYPCCEILRTAKASFFFCVHRQTGTEPGIVLRDSGEED